MTEQSSKDMEEAQISGNEHPQDSGEADVPNTSASITGGADETLSALEDGLIVRSEPNADLACEVRTPSPGEESPRTQKEKRKCSYQLASEHTFDPSHPMFDMSPLPSSSEQVPIRAQEARKPGAYAESGRPAFAAPTATTATTRTSNHSQLFHASATSHSTDGLVEATPVSVEGTDCDSLEKAMPVQERQLESNIATTDRPLLYALTLLALSILTMAGLIILILWASGSLLQTHQDTLTSSPTPAPSFSLEAYVQSLLPEDTLQRIQGDPKSPQSLALEWILQDPHLQSYKPDRLRQRYALSTFYHATNGSTWKHNHNWLDYDSSECHWYNTHRQDLAAPHPIVQDSACDDDDANGTLVRLWLLDNDLAGTIPEEVYWLTTLTSIDISGNLGLSGTVSTNIGRLTALTELGYRQNSFTGTFPSQVGLLTDLNILYLGEQPMHGSYPIEVFSQLTNLHQIAFSGPAHTGTLPTQIGLLTDLVVLVNVGTSLTGSIPTQIGHMSSLMYLWLGMHQLSGTLPSQVGNLSQLKWLNFGRNRLTGRIPSQVGGIATLQELVLGNNQLSSTLPTELGSLNHLYKMDLQHNQLIGSLPKQLGSLQSLTKLSLGDNELTGSLPPQLGNLRALQFMSLGHNRLSGCLPTTLGQLERLQEMWLEDNALEGTLPSELGLLEDTLRFWDFSNNSFSVNETWAVLSMQNLSTGEQSQHRLHHPVE